MQSNVFEHRKSGAKYRSHSKGSATTFGKMGKRAFRQYVKNCLDEWMIIDEIPVPEGWRRRNVERLVKRLESKEMGT